MVSEVEEDGHEQRTLEDSRSRKRQGSIFPRASRTKCGPAHTSFHPVSPVSDSWPTGPQGAKFVLFQVTAFMGVHYSSNRKRTQYSFLQGRAELSSSWVWVGLSDSLLINRIWQKWDVPFRVRLWQDWVCVLGELSLSLGVVPHSEGAAAVSSGTCGAATWWGTQPCQQPHGWTWKNSLPQANVCIVVAPPDTDGIVGKKTKLEPPRWATLRFLTYGNGEIVNVIWGCEVLG